jgi:hypothetical protein
LRTKVVPDVCLDASLFASLNTGIESNVDSLMWYRLLRVKVLNESRICIQIRPGGIPAEPIVRQSFTRAGRKEKKKDHRPPHDDFFRIDFVVQLPHCSVVLHIDGHLFVRLAVQNGERISDFDYVVFGASNAEECADNARLGICAAEVVVEDGKEGDWVDRYVRRCSSGIPVYQCDFFWEDDFGAYGAVWVVPGVSWMCILDDGGPRGMIFFDSLDRRPSNLSFLSDFEVCHTFEITTTF